MIFDLTNDPEPPSSSSNSAFLTSRSQSAFSMDLECRASVRFLRFRDETYWDNIFADLGSNELATDTLHYEHAGFSYIIDSVKA